MERIVDGKLTVAELRKWSARDGLGLFHPRLPGQWSHLMASTCAEVWRAQGGLAKALQVLHRGLEKESAFCAAIALGALIDGPNAAQKIDKDKQILRALLQVGKCCPCFPLRITGCPCGHIT